jgi:glycosyltransferase involved in cell wall biosynthesis
MKDVNVTGRPAISVLMPTFKQASFIARAIHSLRSQTCSDWELIVVDDGSPDETGAIVAGFAGDPRIHYHRLARNGGLGAALNHATRLARGRYIAYLPSDDLYTPAHLERLLAVLESDPAVYLAYGGVQWGTQPRDGKGMFWTATLQGDGIVGREHEALRLGNTDTGKRLHDDAEWTAQEARFIAASTVLAMVQVMHRRDHEAATPWLTRSEIVCDDLERRQWLSLAERGAGFRYTGQVTCQWLNHAEQRHRLIANADEGGIYRYRQHYGVGTEWLNWQPTRGFDIDERVRFGRLGERPTAISAAPDGKQPLHILIAGELGFNPERVRAFEEQGHRISGLWRKHPEPWDAVGPFPFSSMPSIVFEPGWEELVRALEPDIVYGQLNTHAVAMLDEVMARLDVPFVFHFKEGPFSALGSGLWPALVRLMTRSDGQIYISEENRKWFDAAIPSALSRDTSMILDGDLPKIDWMTDDWARKLSDVDGQAHTVVTGRPLGIEPYSELVRNEIHLHMYGTPFHKWFYHNMKDWLDSGYVHLHPTVEPPQWVPELSRYDAAWLHAFPSGNRGELLLASSDDLNLPARIGTYVTAGLPMIVRDTRPAVVAVQNLVLEHDIGVLFHSFDDLASQLTNRSRMRELTENVRARRHEFAMDTHVPALIEFFRGAITRRQQRTRRA